jgi:hypothetical protein
MILSENRNPVFGIMRIGMNMSENEIYLAHELAPQTAITPRRNAKRRGKIPRR